jgi:hypothetical protein
MEERLLSDEELLAIIKKNSGGGGGGGTDDYTQLRNLPQINSVELTGNKSASDLGLVAAETGKGLSTNDYTNEDKAIVGGVTAALADKADKSAIKNEFLGTFDEWNALTVEQRKAYDTYQIKGDYTEGSGGLPDYSSTEQKTGQKWIDGKDIYFRTVELPNNLTLTSQIWISTGMSGVDISTIINAFGNDANGTFFVFNATSNVNNTGNLGFLQTRNVDLVINKFVLYYTKTT